MWLIGIVVRFTEFLFLISFTSVTIITRFSNTLPARGRYWRNNKSEKMGIMWVLSDFSSIILNLPISKNFILAGSFSTFGVVTMAMPAGFSKRLTFLKKSAGFSKCSMTSMDITKSKDSFPKCLANSGSFKSNLKEHPP